jgi:sulfotransferase
LSEAVEKSIHLISGLPRSGSTLLSALLRQNPRFSAGVTSPVAMLCGSLLHSMSGATEFASFFTDQRRRSILRSVFDAYYADTSPASVVFDTNRTWTARLPLLSDLYPSARIICCVREVSWVIDSIERLVRRNAMQPSKLFNFKAGGSVYSRVEILMDPEKGMVGLAWNALREAWFSELANKLIVVRYDSLAKAPSAVMARLYEELGEPTYEHDFQNVLYDDPAYDADLGLPGLHRVRPTVTFVERDTCLPPDIFAKYAEVNFWLNPKANRRGVLVL